MRQEILYNDNWYFTKENGGTPSSLTGERIRLPHTWNAIDGQDGGNDYYRGTCWYIKELTEKPEPDEELWLEFHGAAMTAVVYLNGQELTRHEGGYSTFRVNLTEHLRDRNILAVSVDNGKNSRVYPQKADFTFYGGLYRDVYLLRVPRHHFSLDYFGSHGIKVTPTLSEDRRTARVRVETWQNCEETVSIRLAETEKRVLSQNGYACGEFILENPHLWDGLNDPFLYRVEATLESGDQVAVNFGCRTFEMHPQRGFLLNGREYPLCGASRHQDRQGLGNAIGRKEHEEDVALLREMGANTVRLAHYQHDSYFYDLCDQAGLIVWAEIPYITEHLPEGRENTLSQMQELIVQCHHHPSIICWGLSNEITATSGVTQDMVENHLALQNLCHKLDKTRPTTMAHVFMLDSDDPFVQLADICSYNLYYGWYVGDVEENDKWFDSFHAKHPDMVIGLSEYGADANPAYQSAEPQKGDWSEGYQALYHEHMLKMWSQRPYIWAMHCWNMFDFGADGRDEGGKPGQNQKGLVTFDRKHKKDAFYIYKAYLSKEPFVHLCGKGYADRTEDTTQVKVYSNQPEVTLIVDGKEFQTLCAVKVFLFSVPIFGTHTIEAVSGDQRDAMQIRKVTQPNRSYLKNPEAIINWFDKVDYPNPEGYYSIYDTMGSVTASTEAAAVLAPVQARALAAYGDVAKNIQLPAHILEAQMRVSVKDSLQQMGNLISQQDLEEINQQLNRIKKPN